MAAARTSGTDMHALKPAKLNVLTYIYMHYIYIYTHGEIFPYAGKLRMPIIFTSTDPKQYEQKYTG